MSSPVGSARVEITGDLGEFVSQTTAGAEQAISQMAETIRGGLGEVDAQFTASGASSAASFGEAATGGVAESLAGLPAAVGAEGQAAGEAMAERLATAVRAGTEDVPAEVGGALGRAGAPAGEAGEAAGAKFGEDLTTAMRAGAATASTETAAALRTGGAEVAASAGESATAAGRVAETRFGEYGAKAGEKFTESAKEGMLAGKETLLLGVGALGFGELAKGAIENADSLEGANIKIEHVFGHSADSVKDWAKSLGSSFGLSQADAEGLSGTFAGILQPLGKGSAATADMSEKMVELAANLARARNADPASVETALASALRGRATAMRQYGVDISSTALSTYAYSKGIGQITVDEGKLATAQAARTAAEHALNAVQKDSNATSLERQQALAKVETAQEAVTKATAGTKIPLTDAEKTQASYALILKQTAGSQGAVEDSSKTLAQRQQILKAEFTNLSATVGTDLMPILADAEGFLANDFVPGLEATGHWVVQNKEWLEPLVIVLGTAAVAWKATAIATGLYEKATAGLSTIMAMFGGDMAAATAANEAYDAALAAGATEAEAAAVAQGELDAAMDANPIGLVVAAIAALVIGLIYAWKHSETFRDVVKGAMNVVKDAALGVVHFFTRDIPQAFDDVVAFARKWGPLMLLAVAPVIGIPLLIWQHFSTIKKYVTEAWDDAYGAIKSALGLIVSFVSGGIGKVVSGVEHGMDAVGNAFEDVYNTGKRWLGDIVTAVRNLPGEILGVVSHIASAGEHLMSSFWNGIKRGIGDVGGFVEDIGSAIKNGINSFLHLPIHIPTINTHIPGIGTVGGETLIPALANGGWVTGPGGPRDDGVLMFGSAGEFMVNANQAAKYPDVLEAINSGTFGNLQTRPFDVNTDGPTASNDTLTALLGTISDKLDALQDVAAHTSHLPTYAAGTKAALAEVAGLNNMLTGAVR